VHASRWEVVSVADANNNSSTVRAPEPDPATGLRTVLVPSIRTKTVPGLVVLCATCSVVVECLQAAIADDDRYAVRGGTSGLQHQGMGRPGATVTVD
jgi:hypothetical protein